MDPGVPTESSGKHKPNIGISSSKFPVFTTHGAGTDAIPQIGNSTLGMGPGTALTAQHWGQVPAAPPVPLEQVTPEQPPRLPREHPSALAASDPGNCWSTPLILTHGHFPAVLTGHFHVPRSCVRLSPCTARNRIQEQTEPPVSQESEPLGIKLHHKELYSNVTLLSSDFLRND